MVSIDSNTNYFFLNGYMMAAAVYRALRNDPDYSHLSDEELFETEGIKRFVV